MSRIADNLPNNANGLRRYIRANQIRERYIRNIRQRLENNGHNGPILNLKAPQYVYRYDQTAKGNNGG